MLLRTLRLAQLDQDELDPTVQRRIYDEAQADGAEDVLAKLAGYPNLDPAIDREIGRCGSAKVLTTWLERDGRNPDDVVDLISGERRKTVLQTLAALPGLPRDAYQVILERQVRRADVTLANNPDVPDALRDQARRQAVASTEALPGRDLRRDYRQALDQLVEDDPDAAVALQPVDDDLPGQLDPSLIGKVAVHPLQPATVERLIPEILAQMERHLRRSYSNPSKIIDLIEQLAIAGNLTPDQADRLTGTFDDSRITADRVMRERVDKCREVVARVVGHGLDVDEMIEQARTTSDPDVCRQVWAEVEDLGTRRETRAAAQVLAVNPATPMDVYREVTRQIAYVADRTATTKAVLGIGDSERTRIMLERWGYAVVMMLDELDTEQAEDVALSYIQMRRSSPIGASAAVAWMVRNGRIGRLPTWTILRFPWDHTPEAGQQVAAWLDRRFDVRDDEWRATFDGLISEFDGSIDQLIDAVDALAGYTPDPDLEPCSGQLTLV